MEMGYSPSPWRAVQKDSKWIVVDKEDKVIAVVEGADAAKNARLIALSPYMQEALEATLNIIGDEDLPDNGEYSGAAISDMVRAAFELTHL